ncbi:MAG: hypothetical protein NDP24_04585 [Crenarchaeota archaeon]|nr:hypothetical protein [Thermoproteota archaeon]
MKALVYVANKCLVGAGLALMMLPIVGILKFFVTELIYFLALIYVIVICIMGLLLILSSISFYSHGRRLGSALGLTCAILIAIVGFGYVLSGYWTMAYMTNPNEASQLGLGIATTIIRTSLFFYGFMSTFFFFETRSGELGGYGGILVLFFSSSTFFYVFFLEFIRTLPGAIFTLLASVGYVLQGVALDHILSPPKFKYPPPSRRKYINLFGPAVGEYCQSPELSKNSA